MLMPDFVTRPIQTSSYKLKGNAESYSRRQLSNSGLSPSARSKSTGQAISGTILHAFCPSIKGFHRSIRTIEVKDQGTVMVPRTKIIHRKQNYLYDLIVAQRGRDILVAVPFYGLASDFSVRVDTALEGRRTQYEKLNITNMILNWQPACESTPSKGRV